MATTAVTILVKTLGDSKLKTLDDRLKSVEKSAERVGGSTTRAANGIAATGRSALGASAGVKSFGASLKAALGPIAAVAATIGGVTAGFREISTFNFSGAKVKTLGVDLGALKAELKAVGQELGGSRSQAELLAASYDVASAGFRDAADAALVLKASSLAASGGFSTLAITSDAATSVLNAYGLSAQSAGKIVDQFVQTQNDGKIVVDQYAQSIGVVASAAAGLGIPLSEINAAVAQSTIAGNDAAKVFTGLKVALQRLASGEAAKAIEDTGIQLTAASLESDGLFKTLKKLENLDVGQVFKALGTEAAPALLPVLNNLEEYERLIKNQEAATNTSKNAQLIAADTLQGAYTRLGVAFSDAFTAQEGAVVALIPLIDGVTAAVKGLSTPLGTTITQAALVTTGVVLLGKAFVTLRAVIIALKATALAGWLTQQAALMAAFGVKIYATAAATGALSAAVKILNGVLAVSPWALAALGIAYVAKGAIDAKTKVDSLEASLRDTTGTGEALKQKMNETAAEIERLKGTLDKAGPSADYVRKKIELLTAALNEMKGRYDIEIVLSTYGVDVGSLQNGFYGPGGSAPKPKPKPKPTIATPIGGGGSKGGGGGGPAPRESELPQLQRNLELSDKLLTVDRARLEAQLQGNTEEIKRLSNLRVAFELEGKIADITAEKIPEQEKQVKVLLAQNEAAKAGLDILYQDKELQKQKAEALEGTLRPIQDEITLLQAKLNGNEDEIKQLLEIRDLKKQIAENGGDPSQAPRLIQQRDALKQLSAQQDEAKAKAEQLAGAISTSLTGALRGLIDGSKTAEQALSDAFSGIADAFLDMAMQMIQEWIKMQIIGLVGSLFGGGPSAASGAQGIGAAAIPGLATGGPATGGQAYIVGEEGPELFIPGVSGMVSNTDQFDAARNAMSGGSTAGADGSVGSDSAGVSSAFAENSSSITTTNSYMRERSMERSSQTTVGGGGSVVVETQVINNVEYATVEQMQLASAASAKQARAEVFRDLRNKPATRASVGMR